MKWLIVVLILAVVLIAGCTQQVTQYVCSDGSTVSSPDLCPKTTPQQPAPTQPIPQPQEQTGPILVLGGLSVSNGHRLSDNYLMFKKSELYDSATNGYSSAQISDNLSSSNTEVKDVTFHLQCWIGSTLILDSDNGEFHQTLNANLVTYNLSSSGARIEAFSSFDRNSKSKGTVMNTGSFSGTKVLTLPVDSSVNFRLQLIASDLTATTEFTCKVDFTSSNPSYTLTTDKFTIFYIVDQLQTPLRTVQDKACEQVMKNPNGCMAADPNFIILGTGDIPPFDVNRDGKIDSLDTLQALCENWYMGIAKGDVSTCRKICGCTG
jgi:hypothetical protein